ncbi:MAG: hypothetical protein RLY43_736 [Bacteroidota bacterium]|jgi:acetyltransferase-like isoleucine patch superfamily enzyme
MIKIFNIFKKIVFRILHAPFSRIGHGSFCHIPYRIDGYSGIKIGVNTEILSGSWLYTDVNSRKSGLIKLSIGNNVVLGYRNHIVSVNSISIGNSVLTANNVYISDNYHKFDDVSIPIINQGVESKREVVIGEGSWIGENVCIISSKIGRNCVIGANSVVLSDIGDFCLAAGVPAKVIKKYCNDKKEWIKV